MLHSIQRAAVLGSGVMGSALAAHLANAGIPTLLLDIVPPDGAGVNGDPASREYRDAFARAGLDRVRKGKPAAFFSKDRARRVTVGNLDDDLALLKDCDWILEAVVERLDIKQSLFEKIAPFVHPEAILTSNTSGLSITDMAGAVPESMRPRFLGTHFFNPPRYLHLLELIPHAGTDPAVLAFFREFGDAVLGKGVVVARDTPDFIANRIGTFSVMSSIRTMLADGYTVEEVDALTGRLIGRAKSATFRTLDLVGLDIMLHASATVYNRATDDEKRDYFKAPELLEKMLAAKLLGDKTGKGFYQKVRGEGGSEILTLDPATMDYRKRQSAKFASLELAKPIENLGDRVRTVFGMKDRAGAFVWKTLAETFLYSAARLGEIADDPASIDRAMRWGFGWDMGPFELWDAVGVEATVARMRAEGMAIPAVVEDVLKSPSKSFYKRDDATQTFQLVRGEYRGVETPPATIDLAALKAQGKVVRKNAGASLVDMGDGVLCLEFHSKMNAIGTDIISMIMAGVKETEANFEALVIGNHGSNFSVGANLMLILLEAREGNWDEIDLSVRQFQKATMALKYCRKPVVAAPFGMTLGGGCEVVLGAQHAVASAETYIGLVEVGVGLIPAGGGCKEILLRNLDGLPNVEGIDVFPAARAAFETIGLAKVSTSGEEAFGLKILHGGDAICMNPDRLLHAAKQTALGLARRGYQAPDPTREIAVAGASGIAAMKASLYNMREGKFISEYDEHIGSQLARIICGGELPAGTKVSESYLLQLEREVFLKLCSTKKTLDRMQFMLKEGKPLRN
ncbi:MAG TPA: 3-hydroxyacyl-CoA dehydrogenase NAD-binding domain-containing protein [Candidatus Krumholzibacteria bacterium]|nr:3-hydroxyacyl-CoA dehydrogenase NAD-binding domain-containing protein [Candidatus Krumholzibacteria bacterium]